MFFSALSACSALGVLVSLPLTLVGKRLDINWVVARSFEKLAGKLLGITFDVQGAENLQDTSAIYLGSHQSMLDLLYLGKYVLCVGCNS